jgi:tetratricopeptide (TPR) repeat protein
MESKNAAACHALGEKLYKEGRFREAVDQFKEYIWLNPNDPAGHHSLAMAHCQLREFTPAIESFSRALRIGPEFADVYNSLGSAYSEVGRHQDAAEAFRNAIRLESDNADHHCALAESYLNLHKASDAASSAKEALVLMPDSAEAHLCLACALHFEPDTLDEAIAEYRKSLVLLPDQFVALANLGDAYLQSGRYEESRDSLLRAASINSSDPKLHYLLGQVYLKLGQRDDAARECEILKNMDMELAKSLGAIADRSDLTS